MGHQRALVRAEMQSVRHAIDTLIIRAIEVQRAR